METTTIEDFTKFMTTHQQASAKLAEPQPLTARVVRSLPREERRDVLRKMFAMSAQHFSTNEHVEDGYDIVDEESNSHQSTLH